MQLSHTYENIFITICLLGIIISGSVVSSQPVEVSQQVDKPSVQTTGQVNSDLSWTKIPLTDVKTGQRFTIEDLVLLEKPLILTTFAVWCPSCTMQLKINTELQKENPEKYTMLAIDIDPNENENIVKKHIEKNQLEGKFTTTPIELTKGLVQSFGTDIALRMPQTVIISNGTASYLGGGVFSSEGISHFIAQLG